MKTRVISLGGSLIVTAKIDTRLLQEIRKIVLARKNERFVIVCGGGRTCRNYQNAAKKLGAKNSDDLDWIGVASTRLNAELVRTIFGSKAHKKVIDSPNNKIKTNKKVIIACGWKPGFSTNMGSVVLAKRFKAKEIFNLTNVDYVYDKDPNKFKNAKPIKKIAWKDFLKIVGNKWKPGMHLPFDPIASRNAKKSGIAVYMLNGRKLNNFKQVLAGKKFKGTMIS